MGILDYPWCNNPCCTYQELGQGDFYSSDQKFIYYLRTKNVNPRKTILSSILSIALVREWTSIEDESLDGTSAINKKERKIWKVQCGSTQWKL